MHNSLTGTVFTGAAFMAMLVKLSAKPRSLSKSQRNSPLKIDVVDTHAPFYTVIGGGKSIKNQEGLQHVKCWCTPPGFHQSHRPDLLYATHQEQMLSYNWHRKYSSAPNLWSHFKTTGRVRGRSQVDLC